MRPTYRFLINPAAGLRFFKHTLDLIYREFEGHPVLTEVCVLRGPGEASRLAREAAVLGLDAVVVVGGDGTINEAAAGLLGIGGEEGLEGLSGSRTRLGLVPHGTGNGFARGMGIPLDPLEACEVLKAGAERRIDVGLVRAGSSERCFVNMLGVGMDAWVARAANRLRPLGKVSGLLRYAAAGAWSLAGFHPAPVRACWEEGQIAKRTYLLALANTEQYGMQARIAPGADPSDGRFDLVWVGPQPLWALASGLPSLFKGKRLHFAEYGQVASLRLEAEGGSAMPYHVDGEPAGDLPIEVSLLKSRLRVIAPAPR